MRLVICEYQRMLAEALKASLDMRGCRVLAVTTTVADGVAAVASCEPDVFLIGLLFADRLAGLEAARAIAQRYPATRVALLSGVDDPEILSHVARSGVAGFIRKNQSIDQIAAALDVIAAGGNVLNLGSLLAPSRIAGRPRLRSALAELSPREKEIAARIAGGQSTSQMSFAMDITVGTVRTYVKNVLAKLGVHSRLQLAALASQEGLLIETAALENALAPQASLSWAPRKCAEGHRREPTPRIRFARFMWSSLTGSAPSVRPWRPACGLSPTLWWSRRRSQRRRSVPLW